MAVTMVITLSVVAEDAAFVMVRLKAESTVEIRIRGYKPENTMMVAKINPQNILLIVFDYRVIINKIILYMSYKVD